MPRRERKGGMNSTYRGSYDVAGLPNVQRTGPAGGQRTHEDRLFTIRDGRRRPWDPRHSKLAAYVLKGAPPLAFKKQTHVLYLGAASGTTAGHVADICSDGMVYCIEFSKRSFRDLIAASEQVKNMVPILGDARMPNSYAPMIGRVDVVYQDIAQRDQTAIFLKNMKAFIDPSRSTESDKRDQGPIGNGLLIVKSRSIDVARQPKMVFNEVVHELEANVEVLDSRTLEPFEKDHLAVVVRY